MNSARMAAILLLAIAALGAVGFAVEAATQHKAREIVQKRRSFGVEALSINAGDSLIFVNGDPYAHNVFSRAPEGWLDLGIQEEGDRREVVFDRAGTFDLRCRIHPKMRVMVTVR